MLVDSLNLSTKFVKNELGDPINYKTYIHSADKSENIPEIPSRYQNKERILKERSSINSFRIYDTNLKKRKNPNDIYQKEIERINEEEKNKKKLEGEYLNNIKHGKGKEYNDRGIVIFEGEYLNNIKHGKGKEYFYNNRIKFEGEYKDGKIWDGKRYSLSGDLLFELKNGSGYIKEYTEYCDLIYEGE